MFKTQSFIIVVSFFGFNCTYQLVISRMYTAMQSKINRQTNQQSKKLPHAILNFDRVPQNNSKTIECPERN